MISFPTKVLAATDGSPQARLAVEMAAGLSSRAGAELHVAHVGWMPAMYHPEMRGYAHQQDASERESRHLLDEELKGLKAAGVNVDGAHLRMGRADAEIVDLAEELDVDLIVVGSRGFGGFRRVLVGSVSDSVVRHAHCPVLVARVKDEAQRHPEQPVA